MRRIRLVYYNIVCAGVNGEIIAHTQYVEAGERPLSCNPSIKDTSTAVEGASEI
jgi:hypothetical protein